MEQLELAPNEVIAALNWRYATKKFDKNKKLSAEQVHGLMQALRLAPSSMGLQPYRFFRIADQSTRIKLREVSHNQAQITDAAELFVITSNVVIPESDVEDFVNLGGALRGYPQDSMKKRVASIMRHVQSFEGSDLAEWNARQAYIAIGQLLTAAAVMGIDACPMEGIDKKEYNRILGLNSINLSALAVVALGFRSSEDELQYQAKVRKPLEELILTI